MCDSVNRHSRKNPKTTVMGNRSVVSGAGDKRGLAEA